jgi:hypothetical protein
MTGSRFRGTWEGIEIGEQRSSGRGCPHDEKCVYGRCFLSHVSYSLEPYRTKFWEIVWGRCCHRRYASSADDHTSGSLSPTVVLVGWLGEGSERVTLVPSDSRHQADDTNAPTGISQ